MHSNLNENMRKKKFLKCISIKFLCLETLYGFGTAAEHFYGKKLDELELHEMAMLAGLPQSPNRLQSY